MKFAVSCLLEYQTQQPVTFLLNVRAHEGEGQHCLSETLHLPNGLEHRIANCAATGTRFDQIHAPYAGQYTLRYEAEVDVNVQTFATNRPSRTGPENYDTAVLPYLYPSRYCQSDRFEHVAHELFGHLPTPEDTVRAVVIWLSTHLSYRVGSTNVSTSALDTMVDRVGVCRDYSHLGIAFCRALSIPARYFTGYAHLLQPPDFHACFETWIDGRWLLWDTTALASPDGLVRIGTGRDASDCSICTAFGNLSLIWQEVSCIALDPGYQKMTAAQIASTSISLSDR